MSSLLLLVYRPSSLFGSSTFSSPPLKNIPLALGTLARLLACRLILAIPGHPSRISIGAEKTPEAATIVPSAPTYTRSLLGHLARSLAQAPLPSILEPRDLPRFHPFLSAPRVFSVDSPHIPGNSGATALPACIHRLPVMATATRKASATTRATLRWTQPKAEVNSKTKRISAPHAMAERPLLRSR